MKKWSKERREAHSRRMKARLSTNQGQLVIKEVISDEQRVALDVWHIIKTNPQILAIVREEMHNQVLRLQKLMNESYRVEKLEEELKEMTG